jgi:hypothetical protein
LLLPREEFAAQYSKYHHRGLAVLGRSKVAFVGRARNCEAALRANFKNLESTVENCREWVLHVETNDNTDGTEAALEDFCRRHRQASFRTRTLGRQQFSTEFAGRRTEAMAEYREDCRKWVADHAADADLVVVTDFDAWGGWMLPGLACGIGWLDFLKDQAYGMASVSLFQHRFGGPGSEPGWAHYDCWALRLNEYWDDYAAGVGGWKYAWLPPVGSKPIPVCSAFGGQAVYFARDYLKGTYSGEDCEHVTFHRRIHKETGRALLLCPSMRMVMSWLP